jgi:hypothetical protein
MLMSGSQHALVVVMFGPNWCHVLKPLSTCRYNSGKMPCLGRIGAMF